MELDELGSPAQAVIPYGIDPSLFKPGGGPRGDWLLFVGRLGASGKGTQIAHSTLRKHVEFLDIDRPLYNDHNAMKDLIKSCEVLHEVENEIGDLH